MWSAAGNRTDVYTGEIQFYCEPCWIRDIPLANIFSLTPQQRKKRVALLDPHEREAYKTLKKTN